MNKNDNLSGTSLQVAAAAYTKQQKVPADVLKERRLAVERLTRRVDGLGCADVSRESIALAADVLKKLDKQETKSTKWFHLLSNKLHFYLLRKWNSLVLCQWFRFRFFY